MDARFPNEVPDRPNTPARLLSAAPQARDRAIAPPDLQPGTRLRARLIVESDGRADVQLVWKQPGNVAMGEPYRQFVQAIVDRWQFSPAANSDTSGDAVPVVSNLDLEMAIE